MPTMRLPVSYAIQPRSRCGAGIAAQPGSDMPSASASEFIEVAVPMVLQCPTDGRGRRHHLHELVVADLALGEELAAFPDDGAGAGQPPLPPAVEHRAAGQHDGGDVHRGRAHQAGGRGLVAAGGQHDAIQRVAVQHLDQPEIRQVAVQRRRRPLAGLLDRMHREFQRHAAGVADAVADAAGEVDVMPVAGRQIRPGLRDPDDRLAAPKLIGRDAVVHVALEIQRGHRRIGRVVEPAAGPQALVGIAGMTGHFPFLPLVGRLCGWRSPVKPLHHRSFRPGRGLPVAGRPVIDRPQNGRIGDDC